MAPGSLLAARRESCARVDEPRNGGESDVKSITAWEPAMATQRLRRSLLDVPRRQADHKAHCAVLVRLGRKRACDQNAENAESGWLPSSRPSIRCAW